MQVAAQHWWMLVLLMLLAGCASMVPVGAPRPLVGDCSPGREQVDAVPKEVAKLFATIEVGTPTLHGNGTVRDYWFREDDNTYRFCRTADNPRGQTQHNDTLSIEVRFTRKDGGWKASALMATEIKF